MNKETETRIERMDEFSKAVYGSFVLKRGFWWGRFRGKRIAFCEKIDEDNNVKAYVQMVDGGEWKPYLISVESLKKTYPNLKL